MKDMTRDEAGESPLEFTKTAATLSEPKAWTRLERAADNLRSAKDRLERWEVASQTVREALAEARIAHQAAERELTSIAATGSQANRPE